MKFRKSFISITALLIVMGISFYGCEDNATTSNRATTSADPVQNESGQGGSLARFAIVGDQLYTVDNQNLNLFDISEPQDPTYMSESEIGVGIETIFPRDEETLFIGSERGMYIYDISNPQNPSRLSIYRHIVACDPVVADQQYAYVTLNNLENRCNRAENQLQVIDIRNLEHPDLVNTREMEGPQGLGVDGDRLFVCDNGLKVFDISNPESNIQLEQHFQDFQAMDVIPLGGHLLAIGANALVQYDYQGENLEELSRLPINPVSN